MTISKSSAAQQAAAPIVAKKAKNTVKVGSYGGKSNALGQGGRAAQLKAKGVPGAVIGSIARNKKAAPGQANYH